MKIVFNNISIGSITLSATREEVDTLMERLGTPTIEEMVAQEFEAEVAGMVAKGMDPKDAAAKWEADHIKAAAQDTAEPPKKEAEAKREAKPEPKQEAKPLHLDGPPPQRAVGVKDLIALSRRLDAAGKSEECSRMIKEEFGVDRLINVPPDEMPSVYARLVEIEGAA